MTPEYNYAKVTGLDFVGNPIKTVIFSECSGIKDGILIKKVEEIFQMTANIWEVEWMEDILPSVIPHNWKKS